MFCNSNGFLATSGSRDSALTKLENELEKLYYSLNELKNRVRSHAGELNLSLQIPSLYYLIFHVNQLVQKQGML